MKNILLLIPIALSVGSTAWASTCASGALSIYDVSGFTCTLGDLTFSNFKYIGASSGGAIDPGAAGITVNPVTSGFGSETGLVFTAAWLASEMQTIDSSISFDVSTTNPGGITDLELNVVGGAAGTGDASVAEVSFAPPVSLFTQFSSGSALPTDSTTFAPSSVFSLNLNKDIGLGGGTTTGSGSHVSDVFNLFSEGTSTMTPEPSLLLLCVGLLGFIPVARKFVR